MTNQAGLTWRTSSKSSGGSCVAVATDGQHLHVRDSKDPAGAMLTFDHTAWRVFIAHVTRAGAAGP